MLLMGRIKGLQAAHCQLEVENDMLRRRSALLESGVRMREQHLDVLSRGRKQQQGAEGASNSGRDAEQGGGDMASTSHEPQAGAGPSSLPKRFTSFSSFPDPRVSGWDAATCAAVRVMSGADYRACWRDFVSQAAMLCLSSEAHGRDTPAFRQLSDIVATCLAATDAIVAINPSAYYSSLYLNLLTGQPEHPGKDYWRACLRRIQLEPSQLDFARTAMEEHARRLGSVFTERTSLTADLALKLELGDNAAVELSQRLETNVKREQATNSLLVDLLTLKILDPVQIALLCAASFPLLPDPTSLADVALEMAIDGSLNVLAART